MNVFRLVGAFLSVVFISLLMHVKETYSTGAAWLVFLGAAWGIAITLLAVVDILGERKRVG